MNSKVMYESILSGQLMHESSKPTLSDGTSGDIEDGSVRIIMHSVFSTSGFINPHNDS